MNNETKFSVGDVVEWCGARGIVMNDGIARINVELESKSGSKENVTFFIDGRFHPWHTEPSLKLISKAKKKRKVMLYASISKYCIDGEGWDSFHYSINDITPVGEFIRVRELDKEVEIEE